jgi:hypothetical protein
LSAICKLQKIYSKINDLQSHICKLSYPQKKVLKFLMGGEGVVAVGENCGYIRPTEKAKSRKGAKPPLPATKKKKTINPQFAIVHPYHAHNAKDNREDRTD